MMTEEEQLDIAIELWEKTKEKDKIDFIRGWGFQLLTEDDPCFKEKEYINEAVQFISSYGISIWLSPEEMEKPDSILSRFMFQLNKIKSTPLKILPFAFTLTASDAVNLLPSICAVGLKCKTKTEILTFDCCYGAARGNLAGLSFLPATQQWGFDYSHLKIHSPHLWKNPLEEEEEVLTTKETQEIAQKEIIAIQQIESKVNRNGKIGGILIEPIVGPFGVYFYRKEFMNKLESLCKKLNILILVDETLTVCRTGKLFAFEHFDGFQPDFIVFGKGLAVCGIASCHTWCDEFNPKKWNQTTLLAEPISMLKSIQIMKRIDEDKLFENSINSGKYLLQKLHELDSTYNKQGNLKSRGIASLLWTDLDMLPFHHASKRILPPLTISKKQIDHLFNSKEWPKSEDCFICHKGGQLLICDGCPRVYHISCLKMDTYPQEEKWYCQNCNNQYFV